MKTLKVFGIGIGLVVVILILTIAFLSPKSHMERSLVIDSNPSVIYDFVNNYKHYNDWSPWAKIDPNTKYSYTGPDSGPGARMRWSSENEEVGQGEQWIIESDQDRYVKYGMKFGGFEGDYSSEIILEPVDNGTKVTWTYDGDVSKESMMNKAMGKFFGMFMDTMLGPFYEKGLASLKDISENALTPPSDQMVMPSDTIMSN